MRRFGNLEIRIFKLICIPFALCHWQGVLFSQTPNQIIHTVNERFNKVHDYSADVLIVTNIPSVKMNPIHAKVYYKQPDKFKVKAPGILILPKQQLNFLFTTLLDTASYTAVRTGEEMTEGNLTQVINIIPNQDTDLILGKFWIDAVRGLVLKAQLTTKSQGTILIENSYGALSDFALPDKMQFTVDVNQFKIPKALSMDINSGSKNETPGDGKGRIAISLSNYVVNQGVSDEFFR